MAQSSDPLAGVRLKVERAREHIHDLIAKLHAWRANNPYRVVATEHPRTGDVTFRLVVAEEIPAAWSAIIGDFIHNLRAALDLLACALIRANGAQVTRRSGFPIADSAQHFEAEAAKKIEGASHAAKRFIFRLKPYKSGNSVLWQIHELDVLDKHKIILPVDAAYAHFVLKPTMTVPWQDGPVEMPSINIRPEPNKRFPVKNGDILLRVKAAGKPNERAADYSFAFEMAFGKTQIVDGQPVISTLQQYGRLVERIVEIADRHLITQSK